MKLHPSFWIRVVCCWCAFTAAPFLQAQLAITEVMSWGSTNLGSTRVMSRPDFWELTNFGTNTIDLTGYRFSDTAGISETYGPDDELMFGGRLIEPGESIIFSQDEDGAWTDAAQFRAWWGDGNLRANLQIYFYPDRSFSSSSDAVQLWDSNTNLVDRVELYQARRGFSFTYDRSTGFLDSLSAAGENGAFKAVDTDDVGSPGWTTNSVPLAIVTQPQDQTVDGGTPATFSALAIGLPRPRYQWRFNGAAIPGAVSNVFEISASEPSHAGSYAVELTNGLMSVQSAPAVLHINTNLVPPSIAIPPFDLVVAPGQTAFFQVKARGYELPKFQWQFNGGNIAGATNETLLVANAVDADSGIYSVRVLNSLGSTNASARLSVRAKPNLKITEVMGSRSTNTTIFGRSDWWELTNFDTNAVNLRGYRFDDYPEVLVGAFVITNDVVIQPGESVLFIQQMTPEFFIEWWGEENLPEGVQFVRYYGNGFDATGDALKLWNATPNSKSDYIDRAEYAQDINPDFTPIGGPSRTFWCGDCDEFGLASVVGEWGAIRAARSEDVGSPGYVTNHSPRTVAPRCLEISRNGQGVHFTWKTQAEKRYELLGKDSLEALNWTPLSRHTAAGTQLIITDATATNTVRRFYQLRLVPASE